MSGQVLTTGQYSPGYGKTQEEDVLGRLVAQYEKLFGAASREVCRDAVRPLLSQVPQDEIPAVLK